MFYIYICSFQSLKVKRICFHHEHFTVSGRLPSRDGQCTPPTGQGDWDGPDHWGQKGFDPLFLREFKRVQRGSNMF